MNPKLAQLLLRFYPRSWRDRYGEEFETFLQTSKGGFRAFADVARSALQERIFPTRERGLDPHPSGFQSLCMRAPWAMFSLAPIFLLVTAYFVACLYLWSGWQIFLPGVDTPFGHGSGPVYSLQNIYFQAGKFFYFSAPILVGWITALIAIRQRIKSSWLILGFVLIAWMGSAARIQASRIAVRGGLGHIRMDFPMQSIYQTSVHAFIFFLISLLPYVIWLLLEVPVSTV